MEHAVRVLTPVQDKTDQQPELRCLHVAQCWPPPEVPADGRILEKRQDEAEEKEGGDAAADQPDGNSRAVRLP